MSSNHGIEPEHVHVGRVSRRTRLLRFMAAVLMASFVVTACSPGGTGTPTTTTGGVSTTQGSSTSVTSTPVEPNDPVTLRMLAVADPLFLTAFDNVAKAFAESEGGAWAHVTVEFDSAPLAEYAASVQTAVATGADWDLVQVDGPMVANYAYFEIIRSLGDDFSSEELAQWAAASLAEGSYKGEFYAPPMWQSATMLFYNKDHLDALDITPPERLEDAWTWEEAMDVWEQATVRDSSGNTTQWGIWPSQGSLSDYVVGVFRRGASASDGPGFQSLADDGITGTGYFDAPEAIEGMQFFQDIFQSRGVAPVQRIPDIFETGNATFQLSADRLIGLLDERGSDVNWGVTPIPKFADGTHMTHTGSWHWGINPNSRNVDEAVALVRFASSLEGSRILYEALQQLPAHLGLLAELPEYQEYPRKLFADGLVQIGVPRVLTPGYDEFQTIVRAANESISQGADVAATLRAAAGEIDQALQKYAGWQD